VDGAVRDYRLAPDDALRRVRRVALVAGVAGAVACGVGAVLRPEQFFRSYLVAYLFWVGVPLGCLAILMINYVTGGAWGAVIRRVLESGTRTLPLMALLFVPVALGVRVLYAWAQPEHVAHDLVLQQKTAYLNVPFFVVRAAVYFAAWIVVARFLNRWSLAQDDTDDPWPARRLEQLSRGGLVLLGLTMTFAAIDWAMSLEPHWFSTIYGIVFMGGSVLSAFAIAIPVAAVLASRRPLAAVIRPAQFHDLGNLLLAFVMLWAYFAVSQFLIIWSANLPEEIPWYLRRIRGGWEYVVVMIVVFHFALPFVVLLSRDVKRRAARLAVVAVALAVVRMLDVFWLVTPAFSPERLVFHALDVAALVGVGGLWIATFLWQLDGRPLVPLRDPSLVEEG
jgi:hypothetical protein